MYGFLFDTHTRRFIRSEIEPDTLFPVSLLHSGKTAAVQQFLFRRKYAQTIWNYVSSHTNQEPDFYSVFLYFAYTYGVVLRNYGSH